MPVQKLNENSEHSSDSFSTISVLKNVYRNLKVKIAIICTSFHALLATMAPSYSNP